MSRFLERWSRLKRQGESEPAAPQPPVSVAANPAGPPAAAKDEAPSPSGGAGTLPPIDSLDLAADFSAFMRKEVSESLRRAALRKLFSDPHFHFERMDKLDIYIDDYSGSDPIPADMLQKLRQFESLLRDDEKTAPVPDATDASSPAAQAAMPADQDPCASPTVPPEMGQEPGKTG